MLVAQGFEDIGKNFVRKDSPTYGRVIFQSSTSIEAFLFTENSQYGF